MVEIRLSREFLPAVTEGKKVSTIRKGKRPYSEGNAVLCIDNEEVPIYIEKVRYCRLKDVSEEDARRDGFDTLTDLHDALRRFYPSLESNDVVTVIDFQSNYVRVD